MGYVGSTPVHDLTILSTNVSDQSRDVFGISDLGIVFATSVPEPSPLWLSIAAVLGAAALRRWLTAAP